MDGFEAGGSEMHVFTTELQLKILEKLGFAKERARLRLAS